MKGSRFYAFAAILLCVVVSMASCKSSSSDTPATSSSTTAVITGSVFAAPVSGATVTVRDASGAALASAVTKTDGTYSVSLLKSSLSSTLFFESMGGTFIDEATGLTTTAGKLTACVPGGSVASGSAVHLDSISTIVSELVTSHGKTMDEAKTALTAAFGYVPDSSVAPVLPSEIYTGSTGTQRLAGLLAQVISEITNTTLGLDPEKQFDLLPALAADLADNGKLDGITLNGITLPSNILTQILNALESASSEALTTTYKIKYGYPMGSMGAKKGKTTFTLTITDPTGATPMTGLSLSLMPMMHMPDHAHSAPVDSTITEGPGGTYTCTIYYLMSTSMSGKAAGYWELKVQIGGMMGESAYFYPNVGMSMGDTVSATMKGTDLITSMSMTTNRSYYLFNDGVISGASSTFNLFLATMDDMMTFPAVATGGSTTLHDENGTAWSISTVVLDAYNFDWSQHAVTTEIWHGHWSLADLGLVTGGSQTTVYVTLKVNGDIKSNGTATYSTFMVTP